MTAQDIIAQIIEWDKDASYNEVVDLIEGKSLISDHAEIEIALYDHVSGNEMNAARYALMHLS